MPGTRVAFLTANRADTWCAGVAAQLSRLSITWLHPLGSLDDQLFQIEDSDAEMLVIDPIPSAIAAATSPPGRPT